ncbi:MAG: glycosyltransferase family 4 protein [Bacteroidales bacterium]|nr:glycosyltransferase family 4 protein [Bacteroidales bacterium]MCF8402758.1 glycosyltransferase family 4 protein [Bacteroidales bacterium]
MINNPPKICFLADSHNLFDDRIYWKEAVSLKKQGYDIHIILAGDKEERGTTDEGIHYIQLKREVYSKNRYLNYLIKRILPGGLYAKMLKEAMNLKADVYHFHDLKLNRIGPELKALSWKPKVIYDVHEPYPENIRDYIQTPDFLRGIKNWYSSYIQSWERKCAESYDVIITTEENLWDRFQSYFPDKKVEIIYNYTNLALPEKRRKEFDAIYTGGITKLRGAWQILHAVKIVVESKPKFKMLFLGSWFPHGLKQKMTNFIEENKLKENVILLDSVPYPEMSQYYNKSKIGLGIFLPIDTHRIILQIKIFEYMSYGLPIIGSNFGHIHRILNEEKCGIAVNPEDPSEIASALVRVLSDETLYKQWSENGRSAAEKKFRWELMEKKLAAIYTEILDN